MNILLDFLTFRWQTGAGEYARRVYRTLMETVINQGYDDIKFFALYDSVDGIAYENMCEGSIETRGVIYLDASKMSLTELIKINKIDILFIACAQYFEKQLDLPDVECRVVCVIHDLVHEELFTNMMGYYFKFLNPKYQLGKRNVPARKYFLDTLKLAKWVIEVRKDHSLESMLDMLHPTLELICKNPKTQIITVSEYTRNSLLYQYEVDPKRVKVLYSPERYYSNSINEAENEDLAELIISGKKYYLMLSANRNTKNPHKAIQAFKRYAELYDDTYFLVLGYNEKVFKNMYCLSYLSDSDLALALQHCYALVYPTFFEGFGYPAIEAMHYGKPVLTSYATSIPEIFGDAPIYFSPLYESEIFNALTKLSNDNYELYAKKSKLKYEQIKTKQESDLNQLINIILNH